MEFTINIGLLNNTKNEKELLQYLRSINGYKVVKAFKAVSVYDNCVEPTVVALLSTDYKRVSKVVNDIENLCSVLTQECIAISSDQFDLLVYNISYTGAKQKFNSEYFLTI